MKIERYSVSVTTDTGGDASEAISNCSGIVMQVKYTPDPSTPLATGADLTIIENTTSYNVLTMANIGVSAFTRATRQLTADSATGVEGTSLDYIAVNEPMTLTIAQGGNTLSGVFDVYVLC